MASSSQVPLGALAAWARLNGASLNGAALEHLDAKGLGLVAATGAWSDQSQDAPAALAVPRDLVLSAETVHEYAKVDHNFKQLLDAIESHADHGQTADGQTQKSTRKLIMVYLLCHLLESSKIVSQARGGIAPSPWTEYLAFLPRRLPVPSLWPELDRLLLTGTSLQAALSAKLEAVSSEFHQLRRQTEQLGFWHDFLWKTGAASLNDWVLIDAWYRSRCLELPGIGHAMVPVLDMANHASNPSAYYQVDNDGTVTLLVRPGCSLSPGDELTISYGATKSAAEMLFSYGFMDAHSTANEMLLFLDPLADDPLAEAKLHVFGTRPTLKLSCESSNVTWSCPFVYLMCLNQEDGLEFRILQQRDGTRQLKLFWQDDDVTDRADDFEALIHQHRLCRVFELRAVAVMYERVACQLDAMQSGWQLVSKLVESDMMSNDCITAAKTLRGAEGRLLDAAAQALDHKKEGLLADQEVIAYLASAAVQDEQRHSPPGDDDEFS
ncbi:hypothetical protein CDD81_7235 [Ophiocordyceps australis]|uniref:SET domain-containing protein n=1 Tax=Ophiocordyceps australis TaxID=1399860 RepID=A0A2C5XYH5_9HYPO|nr:hypothetical protein CDD81_7235 [Ophiocordyceps australis]